MISPRLRGEAGASLVLALVLLSLLSVFVVSMLSLGSVSFTNTVVTRTRADQLYAADGGIEYGIQMLAANPPAACESVGSELTTIGTQTINGKIVTIKCKTTATTTQESSGGGGGSPLLGGYAAILGNGGISIGGNLNGAPSFQFKGAVYSDGTMSVPLAAPVTVDGNLDLRTQACLPPNVSLTAGKTCATGQSVPDLPNPMPTVTIPATAPAPKTVGGCTILYPGKYGSGGRSKPNFNSGGRYYLASGTYYFNDTGALDLRGEVFGGSPASTDTKQLTNTPCADDAIAQQQQSSYTAVGTGVTIVLGGNADFRVQAGARVELFTRESPESGTTAGVAIWARTTAQGTQGYNARHGGNAMNTEDKNAAVVLHGLTYLPNNTVAFNKEPLNASAGSASVFMGGVSAQRITVNIDGNNGSQPPVASIAGTGGTTIVTVPSKTVVEATAASTTGGAPTVVTAVIDRPTSAIETWRQG